MVFELFWWTLVALLKKSVREFTITSRQFFIELNEKLCQVNSTQIASTPAGETVRNCYWCRIFPPGHIPPPGNIPWDKSPWAFLPPIFQGVGHHP